MDVIKAYLLKYSFKAFSYSGRDNGLGEYEVLETIYNMGYQIWNLQLDLKCSSAVVGAT